MKIKNGFTLVELIASLAIFSLGILAITMSFSVSFKTKQMNDVKQSTAGYSQAIIESFRGMGYDNIDSVYQKMTSGAFSGFVYFNDMSNFNSFCNTRITGSVNLSTYPLSVGNIFGALIKVSKLNVAGGGTPYHIYVRVWRLDKGSQSQSVRDIYESR